MSEARRRRPEAERAAAGRGIERGSEIAFALSDSLVLARRGVTHIVRDRELWPFLVLQPMVFVLLFALVFGGAIPVPGGGSYREFLMGGVFAQTVAFATLPTALGLAYDLQLGLMDRLRTLPIHPSAIFLGRTLSDLVRILVTVAVMTLCGLAVGWRIDDGVLRGAAGFGVLTLFAFAMSWVGVYLGLAAKSPQAASSIPMIVLLPITFLSSAFVPPQSMPAPLEVVAEWNPVSAVAGAMRELWGNPNPFADPGVLPAAHPVALSVFWSLLAIAVSAAACTRRMRALSR